MDKKDYILELDNVSMKFGGLMAVNEVSFQLERGKILGVIGPNGAGKTTMFNTITGFYQGYTGTVKFNGVSMNKKKVNGHDWRDPVAYDMTINSDRVGRDKAVDIICEYKKIKFGE